MDKYGTSGVAAWFDILMTTCFAVGGISLGVRFALLNAALRASALRMGAWDGFLQAGCARASFGIYLGHVLGLNSWDIVAHPFSGYFVRFPH